MMELPETTPPYWSRDRFPSSNVHMFRSCDPPVWTCTTYMCMYQERVMTPVVAQPWCDPSPQERVHHPRMRLYQPCGDNQRADMPSYELSKTRVNHPGFPTPETGIDRLQSSSS